MINIEFIEDGLSEDFYVKIGEEFDKYALKHGLVCDFTPFAFLAKEDDKIIGAITGNAYYEEVHVADLLVLEEYRNKHIGSKLLETVYDHFKDKGYEHINLTTYRFQAPEFYKKYGYEVEFIRKNKKDPKLDKFYLVKYF